MNRKYLSTTIFGAALLLFAACTNDELTDGTDALPEGMYPLEIASVTMEAESSVEPWGAGVPQTRVSESTDRMESHFDWNDTEQIGVQIENSTKSGIYKLTSEKKVESVTPVYWEDTQPHKVRAWYPANGKVNLNNQTTENGLAYALFAETANDVDCNTSNITLPFAHKLAKVRVVLQGNGINNVEEVKIKTFTSCTLNTDGTLTNDGTEAYIPMVQTTLQDGTVYWEANVVPDHAITEFQVNGEKDKLNSNDGITPIAAKVNTITLDVSIEGLKIEGDTYIVSSATALRAWGEAARENLSLNCTLAADITLTGTDNWTPVGSDEYNMYTGTFDGAGHTISGLDIEVNASEETVVGGLIGALGKGGIVKNLTVTNANISVTNSKESGWTYVGGIVGQCYEGTISGCGFSGSIAVQAQNQNNIAAGGIAGNMSYYPTITSCWSVIGSISSTGDKGAIAGWAVNATINPCYYVYDDGNGLGFINGINVTDNTQKVDGTDVTWEDASEEMNKNLTGYKWAVNTGDDSKTVPLVLEKSN